MTKNINLKLLLQNLILFLKILIFVTLYSTFFGKENLLAGVAIITGILMFKYLDLGYDIYKSSFIILSTFILSGISTFFNDYNIFLSIIINFVSIFTITFCSTKNVKTKMYLPFILLYLFLDSNPIEIGQLSLRISSLIIGGILCLLTIYFYHKNNSVNNESLINDFKEINIYDERFKYSLKMALGITIALLIGTLIKTPKALWISIVVLSVTDLDHEKTKNRIKNRFVASLIGFILFVLLFEILIPQKYMSITVLFLGYVYMFINEYKIKMIFVTINALSAATLIFTTKISIATRLSFLIIGIILTYTISKIAIVVFEHKDENALES